MALTKSIKIHILDSIKNGMVEFYTPQNSNQTMLVQIAPHSIDDLFVHRHQTDQLMAVRGSMVLVVLLDRKYQYIALSDANPLVVTIPPMVPHAAINLNDQPCMLINAVQYHGTPTDRDYRPIHPPFAYDWQRLGQMMPSWQLATSA